MLIDLGVCTNRRPPEDVSVIVSEVQPRDWFVGGRSYAARQSGNHGE
jgi:phenylpyruvate tautomerase PptA (4-oxalocrotonate tautomerase family)